MNERILVVDDEQSISELLKMDLEFEGYIVETAADGEEAIKQVDIFRPNLIVLDVMLPRLNGYEVCKRINAVHDIPIILLTAKTDIVDKVLGLELGADDYLTKPFDSRELLARIKALLRRSQKKNSDKSQNEMISNGELTIVPSERRVLLREEELHLTPKEYELLYLLTTNLEQVFSRESLLEKVWGYDYFGDTRTVDMHIQRIRKKVEKDHNKYIQTVFGVGYKMRRL